MSSRDQKETALPLFFQTTPEAPLSLQIEECFCRQSCNQFQVKRSIASDFKEQSFTLTRL